VNIAAFNSAAEADLVAALREGSHALISLVAVIGGRVGGHIMFSRMWIETESRLLPAVALAPVAVLPEYQRQGIGSSLIENGLAVLREQNEEIVLVLGHPEYYARFGLSTAKAASLISPFPPHAYMALELRDGALKDVRGRVVYPPPFGV